MGSVSGRRGRATRWDADQQVACSPRESRQNWRACGLSDCRILSYALPGRPAAGRRKLPIDGSELPHDGRRLWTAARKLPWDERELPRDKVSFPSTKVGFLSTKVRSPSTHGSLRPTGGSLLPTLEDRLPSGRRHLNGESALTMAAGTPQPQLRDGRSRRGQLFRGRRWPAVHLPLLAFLLPGKLAPHRSGLHLMQGTRVLPPEKGKGGQRCLADLPSWHPGPARRIDG